MSVKSPQKTEGKNFPSGVPPQVNSNPHTILELESERGKKAYDHLIQSGALSFILGLVADLIASGGGFSETEYDNETFVSSRATMLDCMYSRLLQESVRRQLMSRREDVTTATLTRNLIETVFLIGQEPEVSNMSKVSGFYSLTGTPYFAVRPGVLAITDVARLDRIINSAGILTAPLGSWTTMTFFDSSNSLARFASVRDSEAGMCPIRIFKVINASTSAQAGSSGQPPNSQHIPTSQSGPTSDPAVQGFSAYGEPSESGAYSSGRSRDLSGQLESVFHAIALDFLEALLAVKNENFHADSVVVTGGGEHSDGSRGGPNSSERGSNSGLSPTSGHGSTSGHGFGSAQASLSNSSHSAEYPISDLKDKAVRKLFLMDWKKACVENLHVFAKCAVCVSDSKATGKEWRDVEVHIVLSTGNRGRRSKNERSSGGGLGLSAPLPPPPDTLRFYAGNQREVELMASFSGVFFDWNSTADFLAASGLVPNKPSYEVRAACEGVHHKATTEAMRLRDYVGVVWHMLLMLVTLVVPAANSAVYLSRDGEAIVGSLVGFLTDDRFSLLRTAEDALESADSLDADIELTLKRALGNYATVSAGSSSLASVDVVRYCRSTHTGLLYELLSPQAMSYLRDVVGTEPIDAYARHKKNKLVALGKFLIKSGLRIWDPITQNSASGNSAQAGTSSAGTSSSASSAASLAPTVSKFKSSQTEALASLGLAAMIHGVLRQTMFDTKFPTADDILACLCSVTRRELRTSIHLKTQNGVEGTSASKSPSESVVPSDSQQSFIPVGSGNAMRLIPSSKTFLTYLNSRQSDLVSVLECLQPLLTTHLSTVFGDSYAVDIRGAVTAGEMMKFLPVVELAPTEEVNEDQLYQFLQTRKYFAEDKIVYDIPAKADANELISLVVRVNLVYAKVTFRRTLVREPTAILLCGPPNRQSTVSIYQSVQTYPTHPSNTQASIVSTNLESCLLAGHQFAFLGLLLEHRVTGIVDRGMLRLRLDIIQSMLSALITATTTAIFADCAFSTLPVSLHEYVHEQMCSTSLTKPSFNDHHELNNTTLDSLRRISSTFLAHYAVLNS